MKYNVLKNIRKNNLILSIVYFVLGIIPSIMCLYYVFNEGVEFWFLILLFGAMAVLMISAFVKTSWLVIEPKDSPIFKKYGGVEKLEKIMEEIENTIEYEDKRLIISKNYVADKKDFEKIVACEDILRVHKVVHKTNFIVDGYFLVVTDKYNFEMSYAYGVNEEEKVNKLILLIGSKAKNAKLGYTKEAEEHIKKNREELPENVKQEEIKIEEVKKERYACPDCNKEIENGDKFCKNCGCKIDWS